MNYVTNPLDDLSQVIAHSRYEGFSPIEYEYRRPGQSAADNVIKSRRPTPADITVRAMFPQAWGSTALGFGGIGGQSMTSAYSIVLHCDATDEYCVYFSNQFAYKVKHPNKFFFKDINGMTLAPVTEHTRYV